jgi:protein-tyrosine kinase
MSRIHDALKKAELEQSSEPIERTTSPTSIAGTVEEINFEGRPTLSAVVPEPSPHEVLQNNTAPHSWQPDTKAMLFFHEHRVPGQEMFRTLRSRLHQVREKLPLKKVLVGSAMSKEGRSFVAANLAQVLVQQHGKRVLLLDGDLRGGNLHGALGAPPSPGLTDYLQGDGDEFAVMQRGPMENLYFIPAGKAVPNPSELLSNVRMGQLFNRLEPLFDWIIADSSPAVGVADAGVMARHCDGVLLVVLSSTTPYDLAQRARDEFLGKQIIGVVLNGVQSNSGNHAG